MLKSKYNAEYVSKCNRADNKAGKRAGSMTGDLKISRFRHYLGDALNNLSKRQMMRFDTLKTRAHCQEHCLPLVREWNSHLLWV